MSRSIFIIWAPIAPRSKLLTEELGINQIYLVHSLQRKVFLAPIRYVLQTIKTINILLKEKPRLVFVQNPPIFAVGIVFIYSKITRTHYIIDSHSAAFIGKRWEWSAGLHKYFARHSFLTIVTNSFLENLVLKWGAKVIVLKDIPGKYPLGTSSLVDGSCFSVAVVNSFAPDEPLDEIIKAAKHLPDVLFYISGDTARAANNIFQKLPLNVKFTGFLSNVDYYSLLRSVNSVMVLTKHDHTQQRGACEALWLSKPIITSDWPLLREYFEKGAIFVDNTQSSIISAVQEMTEDLEEYQRGIQSLQIERRRDWEKDKEELLQILQPVFPKNYEYKANSKIV